MSETPAPDDIMDGVTHIDLASWVAKAKADPINYRARQATEILLHAIGITPYLADSLYLKGGVLMALAYNSPRTTTDVDFTKLELSEGFAEKLVESLNRALSRAVVGLGYDLLCKVQNVRQRPRAANFETAHFPALEIVVASAARNSNEAKRLQAGQATHVLRVEVSLNEQVGASQQLVLDGASSPVRIRAYALTDLIAEKLRALLQQPIRNRGRRQDVFDIAHLLDNFPLDEEECLKITELFWSKALRVAFSRHDLPSPVLRSLFARGRNGAPCKRSSLNRCPPSKSATQKSGNSTKTCRGR